MEVSCQLHTTAALPPVPITYVAGWDPVFIWTSWRREIYLASAGIRVTIPGASTPWPSHYTKCSVPAPIVHKIKCKHNRKSKKKRGNLIKIDSFVKCVITSP